MHLMIPGWFSELVENESQEAGFQRKGMQPVKVARNMYVSVCGKDLNLHRDLIFKINLVCL